MAAYDADEALKRVITRGAHAAGVIHLLRHAADRTVGPRLLILMYHRIADHPDRFHQALPTQAFLDQIAYIAKHYPCLSEQEVCDYLIGRRPLTRTSVWVTFDDGYRDTATIAQPVLRRHGVPATVFLATCAIGTGKALWPDRLGEAFKVTAREVVTLDRPGLPRELSLRTHEERIAALRQVTAYAKQIPQVQLGDVVTEIVQRLRVEERPYDGMLSWDEVIELSRQGVTVGGHTIHHQTLSRLPLDQAEDEIRRSKAEIEERLGHPLQVFCYPNGTFSDITPAVKRLVERAGFVAGVAAEEGGNDRASDGLALLRVPAYQKHTGRFAAQLLQAQRATVRAADLPTGFRIELVTRAERWDELAESWDALAAATHDRAFFLTWDWLRTWWEVFGQDKRLFVLAVWHPDGRLIGAAPWYVRRERVAGVMPGRVLRWIGEGEIVSPEYLDVLARPEDAADVGRAIGQFLVGRGRQWDLAWLRRVDGASRALQMVGGSVQRPGDGWAIEPEPLPCPYADLPDTWETYLTQLSDNMRHNVQRRRKKLDRELPGVAFEEGPPGGDARRGVGLVRDLHLRRRATQGVTSPFAQPAYLDFHLRLAERLERVGRLYLAFLSVGGAPIAAQYGFRANGTLYAYQMCFDPAYGRQGVAQVLLSHVIEREIQRGTRRVDFLRGDEPYKYDWTKTEHRLACLVLGSPSAAGHLAVAARRGRAWAGRMLKKAGGVVHFAGSCRLRTPPSSPRRTVGVVGCGRQGPPSGVTRQHDASPGEVAR